MGKGKNGPAKGGRIRIVVEVCDDAGYVSSLGESKGCIAKPTCRIEEIVVAEARKKVGVDELEVDGV
jgi:hypothetical protein